MQITKVELKNIKNHAEAEFTFRPGVIAICGPNGSGKTTILEAIAWALFDHLDYKRDDFVKRGTKRGQVAVGFISNLDGREYLVTRDTGGGYYVYDPVTRTRLVEQKNQVLPWLRQQIGVDQGVDLAVLFKTTIGVPQGTFTYDFTLAPSNRKGVFDQILKVEEYRKASENLRDTLRHIETRMAEVDRRLAEAEGELKAYDEIERESRVVAERMESLEKEGKTAQAERDRTGRLVAQFNELQREVEAQRSLLERLGMKLRLTEGLLATAREAAADARAAAKIVESTRTGHDNYLVAISSLGELERQRAKRDQLRDQLAIIERELIEARSQALRSRERLAEAANARQELAPLSEKVERQNVIEQQIALLRESRGELQGLKRSVESIDRELDKLRQRYSTLSRQIEVAEAQRQKAALAESMEQQRSELDQEIARNELALGNYRLKCEHLETLRQECVRLTGELERTHLEIENLDLLAESAEKLADYESRHQRQAEDVARQRAELARDQEMISALESGGLCPLLTEKCLNLKPGESLDGRFRTGIETRCHEIEALEAARVKLTDELKLSRAAVAERARLPRLQTEAVRLSQDLETKRQQLARVEAEVLPGASVGDPDIQRLKLKRAELEKQLREAREAERFLSQAEVLRAEFGEVIREGEEKKRAKEELSLHLKKLGDIEAQLAEAEKDLRALGDPRSLATALNQVIAREEEWKLESERVERRVVEASADLEEKNTELKSYTLLDAEIASVIQKRTESERDYQALIANEKIAATVTAREQEVVTLVSDVEGTQKTLSAALENVSRLEKQYDPEQHRRAEFDLDQWRERSTQITTQLEHSKEHLNRLQTQLLHLNQVREKAREQMAERERASRLREAADFIRDILQKAAPYITESYLFTISNEANQLFREITGRYDVTLRWNKEYEITLEEDGRERPFLNLSGGEQMTAALSVRLALLKELSEINLAFFDEPTTNMDEERRRNLAQQIGRIKDFHQLFVISHDDSFEGYTDQTISLGEKS